MGGEPAHFVVVGGIRRRCTDRIEIMSSPQTIHPIWLRLTHWINVIAVLVLVMSGWRIYNTSPIFSFTKLSAMPLLRPPLPDALQQ